MAIIYTWHSAFSA